VIQAFGPEGLLSTCEKDWYSTAAGTSVEPVQGNGVAP
jgi:hypothetical protein